MVRSTLALLLGASLTLTMLPGLAQAQTRIRSSGPDYFDPLTQAPPLTVRKRAFTDSGTAAPVGYDREYMTEQTTLNQPVYSSFNPDAFGQDVLPRRFDGLGLN